MYLMFNFSLAIHSIAVLKVSKVLQGLEQPIGISRS